MSSALDDDTQRAIAEGRETAGAMLRSAQKDLQKVFIVFLIGFMGMFYALRGGIWEWLKGVTTQRMPDELASQFDIIAQTPFDVILLQAKISLVVGIVVAAPVLLYYSKDALEERGRWPQMPIPIWKAIPIVLLSLLLFVGGLAYGYLLFFPIMFNFLAGNAAAAGFAPHWSIVLWTQFVLLLTFSFGLAAQMPLAITGLSYTGIVPYEQFREKWRYAVVAIFVFGAVFSPPDPFTQIMWAMPLLGLYGFSLYLAKFAVTMKRGSERLSVRGLFVRNWNGVVGLLVAGIAAAWVYENAGGRTGANAGLEAIGSSYRAPAVSELTSLSATGNVLLVGVAIGLVFAVFGMLLFAYRELEETVDPDADIGDPTGIDLDELDEAGVRAAPIQAFEAMSEPEALEASQNAIDEGHHGKAQAILDRYDEAHEPAEDEPEPPAYETDPLFSPVNPIGAIRRGRDWVDWGQRAREQGTPLGVLAVLVLAVSYAVLGYPAEVNSLLTQAAFDLSVPAFGLSSTVAVGAAVGITVAVVAVLVGSYVLLASYFAGSDPTAVNVGQLSAEELERAPPATFTALEESAANFYANRALAAGDDARARLILDRYDEAIEQAEAEEAEAEPGSMGDRTQRAGSTFLDEFAEDTDEEDIGGYYKDVQFILGSLTSGLFYIVGTFMAVMAGSFFWLYTGGIKDVYADFLARVPGEVLAPGQTASEASKVIALHPVEALVFEVKLSALLGAAATLPLIAYFAWPALRERGFVRGRRNVIFGWAGLLSAGLLGGLVFGYYEIAPRVISFLVEDALAANMTISYRITNFFWLIFFTTAGIGILADVPVLMVLLNSAGVSYSAMRTRWREVLIGMLLAASLLTPADILTMVMVTIPLMAAYGVGISLLYVLTLGGRRNLRKPTIGPDAPGSNGKA
ncbi:twin-arginine translocase subunit TatC [Halolamina salifodinae]|uniref:Sec-independent protein translocase protein TatC n=3 Tax=Halolamina salifodinae TaxID=1202767 RepID=A0A8T4GT95_9EURY|nr:twin-arginine translocase subunit TatC [Halolamina salifodinae]MBP1986086.1 sec-independent protein translocase protein TatC [Halolamina salifodinae]